MVESSQDRFPEFPLQKPEITVSFDPHHPAAKRHDNPVLAHDTLAKAKTALEEAGFTPELLGGTVLVATLPDGTEGGEKAWEYVQQVRTRLGLDAMAITVGTRQLGGPRTPAVHPDSAKMNAILEAFLQLPLQERQEYFAAGKKLKDYVPPTKTIAEEVPSADPVTQQVPSESNQA
jgi:hypothetical protein